MEMPEGHFAYTRIATSLLLMMMMSASWPLIKLARVRRDFKHSEASAKKAIEYDYSEHGNRSSKGSNNNGLNQ